MKLKASCLFILLLLLCFTHGSSGQATKRFSVKIGNLIKQNQIKQKNLLNAKGMFERWQLLLIRKL